MKRRGELEVFFPWERRRGPLRVISRARLRLLSGSAVALVAILWMHGREERAAGVRATRATITTAGRAIAAYRADHAGACPREVAELVTGSYARDVFVDAWGQPLRVTCPGRRDPGGFEIASDGPDGVPGGLDRVE